VNFVFFVVILKDFAVPERPNYDKQIGALVRDN
jgi:hypothetical protein